jgi:predicted transcriptional regulator
MGTNTRFKHLRTEILGLSQMALAEALGVSQASISRWETGDLEPSFSDIRKLLKTYGHKINLKKLFE